MDKVYGFYKMFDSLEELINYSLLFPDLPCDLMFFQKFLEDRFREMELNVQMNPEFTNKTAMKLLHLSIEHFIKE